MKWYFTSGRNARLVLLGGASILLSACAAQPSVDLIVAGDYVVTLDESRPVISDGAVAIDDGTVVAVGSRAEVTAKYRAARSIAGRDRVLMPGLINGHTHAAMTLLRGIADDRELMDWLTNYIFPTERRFVDAEFVRVGTELACSEMIRGGTTTFVDMYYFPDAVARAVEGCGLRVLVAPTVIDQKSPDASDAGESLRLAAEFVGRWKGKSNRILPIISAHAIYTLKPEQLHAIRSRSDELGVPLAMHISESRFEVDYSQRTFGTTPVKQLDSLGLFNSPTIGAHLVWPTDEEIAILARRGVGVIHNPSSNMKISSGIAPVTRMLAEGVRVGLGTDGAATNNDLDMWEEMRLAAFLQKVATTDPQVVPARTALRMATLGGAEALGLADQIGALTAGRRGDLIQVSLADLHFTPLYDVISHLVYVADSQDVVTVVVDGKVLMDERRVLTVDEQRVRSEATAIAVKIRAEVIDAAKTRATP
jgi:5-methylthioadenosine/S-adenosylhomocysteine deaminase